MTNDFTKQVIIIYNLHFIVHSNITFIALFLFLLSSTDYLTFIFKSPNPINEQVKLKATIYEY